MKSSLCETCQFVRIVETPKGSRFLLCQQSTTDDRFPKYPPQPVILCRGYQATASLPTPDDNVVGR